MYEVHKLSRAFEIVKPLLLYVSSTRFTLNFLTLESTTLDLELEVDFDLSMEWELELELPFLLLSLFVL